MKRRILFDENLEPQIDKSQLRKIVLDYRRLLDSNEFAHRNKNLLKKLSEFIQSGNFLQIHSFLPIKRNNEPDVSPIFPELITKNRQVVLSKTDVKKQTMEHFYYDFGMRLVENKLGIPEPIGAKLADFSRVDLILVPLLVADRNLNRIGYGGGFYDRLLKRTKAVKTGLSLSPPVDFISQSDDWDIKLDEVIRG